MTQQATAFDDCPERYFLSLPTTNTSNCERQHLMTVGAGIASPSVSSTFGENPAGLMYNRNLKTLVSVSQLKKGNDEPSLASLGGAAGNGTFGVGAAIHQLNTLNDLGKNQRSAQASYGIASDIAFLKLGLGIAVSRNNSGQVDILGVQNRPKTSIDVGGIINPKGSTRLGAMVFNVSGAGRNSVIAAGFATFIGKSGAFALDFSSARNFQGKVLRPAIGLSGSRFQFTAGYGFDLDDQKAAWTPPETTIGLGVWILEGFRILYYLNRLEHSYLGMSIKI